MSQTTARLTAAVAALVLSCGIALAESSLPQSSLPQSSLPKQGDAKADNYERWDSVREIYFPGRTIEDGSAFLSLEAPYRAQDAALVPVTVKAALPADAGLTTKSRNPMIDVNS